MPETDAFATVAGDLYAGPASTFVARRRDAQAAARASDDHQLAERIGRLRRPTTAAAAVNALPEEQLASLSDLAARLRSATSTMQVAELKKLTAERGELIASILAGLEAAPAIRDEVRATLLAALADPAAEAAVRSRTLVRSLSYSGFGEVDLGGAAVAPPPPVLRLVRSPEEVAETQRQLERAERRVAAAQDAFDAAEAALSAARGALHAAQRRVADVGGGAGGGAGNNSSDDAGK